MKSCTKCKIEKSLNQFRATIRTSDGHSSQCRECLIADERKKRENERAKRLEKKQALKLRTSKRCMKCNEEKPIAEFRTAPKGQDGYRTNCRECNRAYNRAYYKADPEKGRQVARDFRKRNREKVREALRRWYAKNGKEKARQYRAENPEINEYNREYSRKWREENRELSRTRAKESRLRHLEKSRARERTWRSANKEKQYAITQRWRDANREYTREYAKEWVKKNPERALDNQHRRRARMQNAFFEKVDFKIILTKYGMTCHLCGKKIKRKELSFDHLIPLNRGGPHVQWNIAPAHRACNSRKRDHFVTPAQPPLFA